MPPVGIAPRSPPGRHPVVTRSLPDCLQLVGWRHPLTRDARTSGEHFVGANKVFKVRVASLRTISEAPRKWSTGEYFRDAFVAPRKYGMEHFPRADEVFDAIISVAPRI